MKAIVSACAAAGLIVAAVVGLYASAIGDQEADQALRATVRPRIGHAPAVVIIEALIEPASENRFLDFVVDSGDFYRSSTIELTGAGAPRVNVVEFRAVPAGSYDVLISMREATGKVRARLHDRFVIVCARGTCK
jgi:hypothetical protein